MADYLSWDMLFQKSYYASEKTDLAKDENSLKELEDIGKTYDMKKRKLIILAITIIAAALLLEGFILKYVNDKTQTGRQKYFWIVLSPYSIKMIRVKKRLSNR